MSKKAFNITVSFF